MFRMTLSIFIAFFLVYVIFYIFFNKHINRYARIIISLYFLALTIYYIIYLMPTFWR